MSQEMREQAHEIKRALLAHCRAYVSELLSEAREGITRSQEAANLEEKSSAGDKFETQRAMMHLQMELFIERLGVAQRQEDSLNMINIRAMSEISEVTPGALVQLEGRHYFIALSAPPLTLNGVTYTCLSQEAPLYQAMRGLREGDWVEWGEGDDELEVVRVV